MSVEIKNIHHSKSMANRLLILESYQETQRVNFKSEAQDVLDLKKSLERFKKGKSQFLLHDGGTSLRFFLVRLSRQPGEYEIKISKRLAMRPHGELVRVLNLLNCQVEFLKEKVLVKAKGWPCEIPPLNINCSQSSQYLSAILLNCVFLEKKSQITYCHLGQSISYALMTVELMRQSGISIEHKNHQFIIHKKQRVSHLPSCEIDMSNAFSLVAACLSKGQVIIKGFPIFSLQGDFIFVDYLKKMGVKVKREKEDLFFFLEKELQGADFNLKNTPDLLPCLAILCALAKGESRLYHIENTRLKESDRVLKTIELIKLVGGEVLYRGNYLEIKGGLFLNQEKVIFDPDKDHRMAMASGILKASGFKIDILTPEVVNKSCPQFWRKIGVKP